MPNKLPPRDLEMEARSMEAFMNGDSIPLQQRIFELRAEAVKKYLDDNPSIPAATAIQQAVYVLFIAPLQEKISLLEKHKQAIEMLENGPVQAVSILDTGEFSITVKSGIASISSTHNNESLADTIISVGKAYAK